MKLRVYQVQGPETMSLADRPLLCTIDQPVVIEHQEEAYLLKLHANCRGVLASIEPDDTAPAKTLGELFKRPTPKEQSYDIVRHEDGTLVMQPEKGGEGPRISIKHAPAEP